MQEEDDHAENQHLAHDRSGAELKDCVEHADDQSGHDRAWYLTQTAQNDHYESVHQIESAQRRSDGADQSQSATRQPSQSTNGPPAISPSAGAAAPVIDHQPIARTRSARPYTLKINAIEVGEGRGEELEKRFAARAREVENMPGFEGFELLRPVEGETRYFVYTRWDSNESFLAWVNSEAFQHGHRQARNDSSEKPVAHGSALLSFEVVIKTEAAG